MKYHSLFAYCLSDQQLLFRSVKPKAVAKTAAKTVWDEISEELNAMTDAQKDILFRDTDYQQSDKEVAMIAARYQMSLLMPYVV